MDHLHRNTVVKAKPSCDQDGPSHPLRFPPTHGIITQTTTVAIRIKSRKEGLSGF
jgi:hypothetical protein